MSLLNCARGYSSRLSFVRYFQEITLSKFPNGEIVQLKQKFSNPKKMNKHMEDEDLLPHYVEHHPGIRIKTFRPFELSFRDTDLKIIDESLPNFEQQCCYLNFGKQMLELDPVKERLRRYNSDHNIAEEEYTRSSDDFY